MWKRLTQRPYADGHVVAPVDGAAEHVPAVGERRREAAIRQPVDAGIDVDGMLGGFIGCVLGVLLGCTCWAASHVGGSPLARMFGSA